MLQAEAQGCSHGIGNGATKAEATWNIEGLSKGS
jgi:hypothetical protein